VVPSDRRQGSLGSEKDLCMDLIYSKLVKYEYFISSEARGRARLKELNRYKLGE
jgi:hypothetical protein